jgi:hypothetical protein
MACRSPGACRAVAAGSSTRKQLRSERLDVQEVAELRIAEDKLTGQTGNEEAVDHRPSRIIGPSE